MGRGPLFLYSTFLFTRLKYQISRHSSKLCTWLTSFIHTIAFWGQRNFCRVLTKPPKNREENKYLVQEHLVSILIRVQTKMHWSQIPDAKHSALLLILSDLTLLGDTSWVSLFKKKFLEPFCVFCLSQVHTHTQRGYWANIGLLNKHVEFLNLKFFHEEK